MKIAIIPILLMFALGASLPGCAFLAGAAAGGGVGYVAGHEAGEDEAEEEIREHEGGGDINHND